MSRLMPFLVLALAGCAQLLEPRERLPPSNLPVEFEAAQRQGGFSVHAEGQRVVVQDEMITGVCHTRENRGAYLEGATVTLWIAHTGGTRGVCPAVATVSAYRATIRGLPPGTYLLRVQYIGEVDTATYPRPSLEQPVTVP